MSVAQEPGNWGNEWLKHREPGGRKASCRAKTVTPKIIVSLTEVTLKSLESEWTWEMPSRLIPRLPAALWR